MEQIILVHFRCNQWLANQCNQKLAWIIKRKAVPELGTAFAVYDFTESGKVTLLGGENSGLPVS